MGEIWTAALVKYDYGHRYVEGDPNGNSPYGRRETYIQMGGIADTDLVDSLTLRLLAGRSTPLTSRALTGVLLDDSEIPGVDYVIGDKMDGGMILGLTIAEDVDGIISITPELDNRVKLREEEVNRILARMAAGGNTANAHPATKDRFGGGTSNDLPPEFTHDGTLTVSISPAWIVKRPFQSCWLEASLTTAGSGPTVVSIASDTTVVGNCTLGSGIKRAAAVVNRTWVPRERLVLGITSVGAGASKLQLAVRGALI